MEKLYTARVGLLGDEYEGDARRRYYGTYKICIIGVCGQSDVCIRGVTPSQVSGEVPELAI